ncbi:hypothetical protein [uncultured Algimonas sp.]|uniref:hypothetical protein n=1 Tax=uncultured Algimonas sp. TaxID=1547920 RepID=UPI00260FD759|nr:hypothetical protein [uncultured Algimonas sp.]
MISEMPQNRRRPVQTKYGSFWADDVPGESVNDDGTPAPAINQLFYSNPGSGAALIIVGGMLAIMLAVTFVILALFGVV